MVNAGSFWDDPEVKAALARPTYAKFEKSGDKVVGTVFNLRTHQWDDGRRGVQIRFEEDGVPIVTASQILLVQHLRDLCVEVGDGLSIELTDVDRSNGKTLKKWRVERPRDGETVIEVSP
jgi:hypothetical protein